MSRPRTPAWRGAATVLAVVALTGCATQPVSDDSYPLPTLSRPATSTPQSGPAAVRVARWAVLGPLVSVEVHNPNTDVGLVGERVRVVVRDRFGAAISTSPPAPEGDACCTLYELPPGGRHAVYLDVTADVARRATSVEVSTPAATWRPWRQVRPPRAEVRGATLRRLPGLTEVHGRLTVTGARDVDVSVQVALVDPAGRLVAVVMGLLGCYRAPQVHPIRLELFHAVPANVRIENVHAYAFRPGQFPGRVRPC